MYFCWNVWLTVLAHQFLTCSTTHILSSDLQGSETLLPSPSLYEVCLEENLGNCELLLYDGVDKRGPKFNAWGGKRAKFSSWGGKRGSHEFNSWGGKRASWELYPDDLEMMEKRTKFNSWGGKRSSLDEKRAKFNSWGGKRAAKFNSWGGKRTPEEVESVKRAEYELGFKRKPTFYSWGGKRSVESSGIDNVRDELNDEESEHSIKKRETSEEEIDAHMPDLWKEFFDRISNPNFNKKNPYDQVSPVSTIAAPVKKSPAADSQLQRLFKQFVYWTGNRPGEKKNMVNSRLLKERNSSPMRRGSVDFYAWGGKRSESEEP